MLQTTPSAHHDITDIRQSETADLISRIVEAEARVLDRGDGETADVLSDAVTYITDHEWHTGHQWTSAQETMDHYLDRLERMYAALRRAES